jgi:hypothetical protein
MLHDNFMQARVEPVWNNRRMKARWIRMGELDAIAFDEGVLRLAAAQAEGAAPILAWAEGGPRYLFALIAPRKHAPGRSQRWLAWALAPAVATYRQFGLRAYLDRDAIALHGETIGRASARAVGECAVIVSSFLARFPAKCVATPSSELEQAFRLRLEAQHGWEFDHSWPTEPECVAATCS